MARRRSHASAQHGIAAGRRGSPWPGDGGTFDDVCDAVDEQAKEAVNVLVAHGGNTRGHG